MFTGIVEELGEVVRIARAADTGTVLSVRCHRVADGVPHGGSIAVNGVCLTVVADAEDETDPSARRLDFDVMGVTLAHTGIGHLQAGSRVNLERAVRADGRLDGHIVQGHVDGTATVISRTPGEAWESVRFALPGELARYVARKGSITVDGVSLTVSDLGIDGDGSDWFEVGLIPETLRATTLGGARPGTVVNLEVDVLAKYTERLLAQRTVAGATS
ncbi:MAG: riboflavin synthase [Pseudonocardiales bacterium]|nr:riboflavin synthase [Pseudonocardiales bacterium]